MALRDLSVAPGRRPTFFLMKTQGDNLVELAMLFLAARFAGSWDDEYLQVHGNEIHVSLDRGVAERNGELMLTDIEVEVPGERLGGRVIEALKAFSDHRGVPLLVGPCTNLEYWDTPDGSSPHRHPWLGLVGDERGDPVYGYSPKKRD